MTDTDTPAALEHLPLSALYLHPLNPRQTVPEGDPEVMADSIAVTGLLQNLIGYRDPDGAPGSVGIVGGGRRLRGLQLLADRGDWTDPVAVLVKEDTHAALTAAAAENEGHAALTPAQEIRLYARLAGNALSPGAIARAHGVSIRRVQQRLRLAELPEAVIAALEAREITADAAHKFTLCDDPARVLDVLDRIRGRDVSPLALERALNEGGVRSDDHRAAYLGEDAYLAGGGTITRDLFAATDIWADTALLDRLFRDRLTADAEAIKADEGWSEVRPAWDSWGPGHAATEGLTQVFPELVDLPEADAAELERLAEEEVSTLSPADRARLAELEARARGDYTDDTFATCIIFVWVDRAGTLQRTNAYLPRAAAAKAAREARAADSAAEPEAPGISQALRDDLHRIATGALQAALLDRDHLDLALALMTYEADLYPFHRVTGVQIHEPPNMPTDTSGLTLPDAITEMRVANADRPDADALAALLDGRADDFLRQLQALVARSATARFDPYGRAVMDMAGVDIRAHWTPGAANFFGRCKPAYLKAVFAEVVHAAPPETTEAFAAQKKAQMAETLEKLFAGDEDTMAIWCADGPVTRAKLATWLPEEIRGAA